MEYIAKKCVNCSAPILGTKCPYCGTEYIIKQNKVIECTNWRTNKTKGVRKPITNKPSNSVDLIVGKDKEQYKEIASMVSLSKLFTAMGIEQTPMQVNISKLFDEQLSEWNQLTLVASRRSGKTFTAAAIIVRELLIPNSSTVCVSRSAKSMSNLFKEILKNLRTLGVKTDKINSQQYYIEVNGSVYRGGMISATEGLLSSRASLIVFDECGIYDYADVKSREIEPMRTDFGLYEDTKRFVAKIVMVSSPRFIGSDFYNDYQDGLPPITERHKHEENDLYISDKGFVSLHYSIYNSPLVTPAMIETIRAAEKDDNVFKTEYAAEFVTFSASNVYLFTDDDIYDIDLLFSRLKAAGHLMTEPLPLFIGLDIGYKDNTAIVVSTVVENVFYVVDCYDSGLMTHEDIARTLKELIVKWENHEALPLSLYHGTIHSDPSAVMTNHSLILDHDIPIQPGYNRIKIGVDTINNLFRHGLLKIPHNQPRLIEQLKLLAYSESSMHSINANKLDPFIKAPKGLGHWDLVQAFRYSVVTVSRQFGIPEIDSVDLYASTYTQNGII